MALLDLRWQKLGFLLASACLTFNAASGSGPDARGGQFISFKGFSSFEKSPGSNSREIILTSPQIFARIHWQELIASWNAEMPASTYLKIEARGVYPERSTTWFTMGLWSSDPALHPRESALNQKTDDGRVST